MEPLFYYAPGKSPADYNNKSFVPVFLDDFDPNEVATAEKTCSGDQACVFDLLLTKNEELALNSGATSAAEKALTEVTGKSYVVT